jgi:hypothetical protein
VTTLSRFQAIEALIKIAADRHEAPIVSIVVDQMSDFTRDRTRFLITVENEVLERYARQDKPDKEKE